MNYVVHFENVSSKLLYICRICNLSARVVLRFHPSTLILYKQQNAIETRRIYKKKKKAKYMFRGKSVSCARRF